VRIFDLIFLLVNGTYIISNLWNATRNVFNVFNKRTPCVYLTGLNSKMSSVYTWLLFRLSVNCIFVCIKSSPRPFQIYCFGLCIINYQLPNNVMFYYYKCLFEKTSQQCYLVDFNMFFGRRGGGRWRPWVAVITVYHCYYIVITYLRRAFYQRLQFCIWNLLLKCMGIIFNAVQHR